MTCKSHDLQVTWPASHITCKSHDLQVTWPASHMTKSRDLQVTWPASHMTCKSHDQQVTWLYHTILSPCLIQRRSGHWKSSLMGYSTLPTWVNSLVVRTTDWRKRSPHHHCQNQRTVMHFTTYDHVRWHDCHMTVTWLSHDITLVEQWTYIILASYPGSWWAGRRRPWYLLFVHAHIYLLRTCVQAIVGGEHVILTHVIYSVTYNLARILV